MKNRTRIWALALAALLLCGLGACGEEEPVLDAAGQEVTFFALEMDTYVCSYSDESIQLNLTVLALDKDYAKKGSIFRSAELIAPNGVRYPLQLASVSAIDKSKDYYGYDGYSIQALLELPAVGLQNFFALELRYGEEEERVEIIPIGDWSFEVIARPNMVEPIYSAGFTEQRSQEDLVSIPYHFNLVDPEGKLLRIWISPTEYVEDMEEGLPLSGRVAIGEGAALRLVCPKIETEGTQGRTAQHGSPVFCGVPALPMEKENKEAYAALGAFALEYRLAFAG